jgi:pSer/pThr/pTyr-binding forkhead associated (FHA) protein
MLIPRLSYSEESGRHERLLTGNRFSIGRSANQDDLLADSRVSRNLAVILGQGAACGLIDLGSNHGTFVNAKHIERTGVTSGDLLQMDSDREPKILFETGSGTESDQTGVPLARRVELPFGLVINSRHNLKCFPACMDACTLGILLWPAS